MKKLQKEIIDKFLCGRASKAEIRQIAEYIYSEKANNDLDEIIKNEFESKSKQQSSFDPKTSIQSILNIINVEDQPKPYKSKANILIKIAAAISFLLVASITIISYLSSNENRLLETKQSYASEIKSTSNGQKLQFKLPDGSMVYLNSASSVDYLADFADGQRIVSLNGEAYFDVVSDSLNPFIVQIEEVEVQVLGTKFNVNNYNENASVALLEGNVILKHPKGNRVDMSPGEVISADASGIYKSSQDINQVTGWKDGWLYFEGDNLEEIKVKLEKWYGIPIEVSGEIKEEYHYTGKFRNKSLEEVLNGISFVMMFDFQIINNNVKIIL